MRFPDRVETEASAEAKRVELEGRKARILDMFEAGHIDRAERERRLSAVYDARERLDAERVTIDVPTIDWTWPPREINGVLRTFFEGIELDRATFQPVRFGWRSAEYIA